MSNSLMTIQLSGHLCADPRIGDANGKPVANLRVAGNFRVRDGEEWVDEALYFDVAIWRGVDAIANYFKKGSGIIVHGDLGKREWVNQQSGERQETLVINNASWFFPPKGPDAAQQAAPRQQGYGQPAAQYQPPQGAPQYQQPPMMPPAAPVGGNDGIPW